MKNWLNDCECPVSWSNKAITNHNLSTTTLQSSYEVLPLKYCFQVAEISPAALLYSDRRDPPTSEYTDQCCSHWMHVLIKCCFSSRTTQPASVEHWRIHMYWNSASFYWTGQILTYVYPALESSIGFAMTLHVNRKKKHKTLDVCCCQYEHHPVSLSVNAVWSAAQNCTFPSFNHMPLIIGTQPGTMDSNFIDFKWYFSYNKAVNLDHEN